MKFVCDKCNTRYSIADERVRGRVLKIRCKACNHVITVREEVHEPLNESFAAGDEHTMVSTAPPPAREDAADEWFVSFDGEQEGPLPLSRALDRVRAERPAGKECYCWRAGFFVWLPVDDVPEFAPALNAPKPLPPPPLPAATRPPVPAAALKSQSGSQPIVRSPSGSQPALGKSQSGPHAPIGRGTGSQPLVAKNDAANKSEPIGKSDALGKSGSQAAIGRVTGGVPKIDPIGKGSGSQPAIGKSTGSQPMVGKSSLPAPAFELPGFDSGPLGPLGAPSDIVPALPTRPEPRVARREEAQATSMAQTDIEPAAPVSPFAAALQSAGPTHVSESARSLPSVPKPEQKIDTGPVPLPPPPGDELPIGEASGLISLAHISKAALPKPTLPGKPIETFGGVPVLPSGALSVPSGIVAAPGAAPGSAPVWMKWAALAGGLATIGLGVVVAVLLSRKPTVIVVPPAPTLEDKKPGDSPILLADPGPSHGTTAPKEDNEPARRNGKQQHARSAKLSSKEPSEKLNGEQGKLAALYRNDEGEHAVKADTRAGEHASGGGQASEQAIMAVVNQNRRALNLCYERVLKHDSSLKSGRVVTHVKIGISGSVTGVSVPDPQYSNSELGQCIAQTIKHWHFPSSNAEYETEFPIILQAN